MDEKLKAALAEQMVRLRQVYLAKLPDEFAALRGLASSLAGGERDRPLLDEVHHRLHKLVGAGGSFGLTALSGAARVLEQRVKAWLDGSLEKVGHEALRMLEREIGLLADSVSEGATLPIAMPRGALSATHDRPMQLWLVEDDPLLGEALARQLESFNYAVRLFSHLDEAERAAACESPDMLVMDVMYDRDATNATEAFASCHNLTKLDCPIVFISSRDDFDSRARAARLGAVGYFLKPLDVPRLVNRIAQVFELRQAPPQRVLIVDDDADLAEHYRLVLLTAGMDVMVLQDPRNIVETVAATRPELILMDLHMPGFSGPELAGVIRQYERWASLPIAYLSAETDLAKQVAALGQGADDFLTKPISDNQLVVAVRARVDRARQLESLINKDGLTGLLKHASIKEAAEHEILRARRIHKPISVAMIDIDHFKSVNDSYGHATGDVVISALATLLRQRLRVSDIVGRYGGEEFVVVLPECDSTNAKMLLDDIRERFAALSFSHQGQRFVCTFSAGIATARHDLEAASQVGRMECFFDAELLVAADDALYVAKHGGRNQVCTAADSLPPKALASQQ